MPERPAAFDTTLFPPTLRRLLLVAASVTLAYSCWYLLDEGDPLNAQDLGAHGARGESVPGPAMQRADLAKPPAEPAR